MTNNIEERLSNTEYNQLLNGLMARHGLFYQLWILGRPYFTDEMSTAAISFNKEGEWINFQLNKQFWDKQSLAQREFIVAHECMHVILNHGFRILRKFHEMDIANLAMDIVVNHSLVDRFGFDREICDPENKYCWIDTVFENPNVIDADESFEYYYIKLKNEVDQYGDSHKINSSGAGKQLDNHDNLFNSADVLKKVGDELSDSEKETIKDFIDKNISNDFDCIGSDSGGLRFLVPKQKIVRKKKWESIIKKWSLKYLTEHFKENYQWLKVHRRYNTIQNDFFIYSESDELTKYEEENKIAVWFFQDTSGSCAGFRTRFFKAAQSLSPKRFDIRLFCFDTKVYETTLKSRELFGFGGTSYFIIESFIQRTIKKENIKYPEAVFVVTDGDGDKVNPQFPEKWYWFLSKWTTYCIPEKCRKFNLKDYE